MTPSTARLQYLWDRYANRSATEPELQELTDWLAGQSDPDVFREAVEPLLKNEKEFAEPDNDVEWMYRRISSLVKKDAPVSRVYFLRRGFLRYAAAILLLIGLGSAVYFLAAHHSTGPAVTKSNDPLQSDKVPGRNRAVLTLSDGATITLDSAANGAIAQQGNASIVKLTGGRIVYSQKGSAKREMMMNTMSTPKGGKYQLLLPDGSKVWLNAASSITYPVVFSGRERKVTITGEAYFEVQKDNEHPFIVNLGGVDITVLGTEFNINAYPDEQDTRVTLLQGAVKVTKTGKTVLLRPGDQARITQTLQVTSQVNTDAVIAWKNGTFDFTGVPLDVILRQLSRWYDVDIIYQGPVKNVNIGGEIGMDLNLSQVLKVLIKMGLNARLEGKRLILLP
jgi:ferric-dicitrate binding protein FerR (iron transport regulator)